MEPFAQTCSQLFSAAKRASNFRELKTYYFHNTVYGRLFTSDTLMNPVEVTDILGLVNQRYLITLAANSRILEVSSNHERLKESVAFEAQPNMWYRLKTRVDPDKSGGGGFVRAKLWERGKPEPEKWTIEVRQDKLHEEGAPGVFAFSPQSQKRVFIDNLSLTANE